MSHISLELNYFCVRLQWVLNLIFDQVSEDLMMKRILPLSLCLLWQSITVPCAHTYLKSPEDEDSQRCLIKILKESLTWIIFWDVDWVGHTVKTHKKEIAKVTMERAMLLHKKNPTQCCPSICISVSTQCTQTRRLILKWQRKHEAVNLDFSRSSQAFLK